MVFNSPEFFLFFAVVYTAYRLLPFRPQNAMLLVAGYLFYGWWDVRFLYLIAFSTTVDFSIGLMLGHGRMPARQRVQASTFLIGAAFFFLCVRWSAISVGISPLHIAVDRAGLLPGGGIGWMTLGGTGLFVLAANVLHPIIANLQEAPRRRLLLFTTVFVNLAFLGFFKYFNFFIGSAEAAIHSLGMNAKLLRLHVLLPVGISFYTFQSLSYTIDVYRGLTKPTAKFWEFALFVAYFAPMVAGPIERARHLLPQLQKPRTLTLDQSVDGVLLVLLGLFKKVAIANGLAPAVDAVYNSSGAVPFGDVAGATVLFAMQIFCDFSGYSDIARGVSKLLGIELVVNFDLPYFSRNPAEFWRRWHISLSSWLRDYLYIPLGGNRKGSGRTYFNLMTTMVIGGLWHGAAWNYVLWGFYQGSLLCGHRLFTGGEKQNKAANSRGVKLIPGEAALKGGAPLPPAADGPPNPPPTVQSLAGAALAIGFFFLFVCYGWLLFRANSFHQIMTFTRTLAGFGPRGAISVLPRPVLPALLGVPLLLALNLAERFDGRMDFYLRWPRPLQGALYAAMILILVMGTSNAPVQFIYFQF